MARESIVGDKSLAFGKRIARCYRYLHDKKKEADYFNEQEFNSLKTDNDELLKLLTSIIKTTKENDPNQ